ncbi:hypothetical protein V8E53_006080 [Lactarius tabidus]
MFQVQNLATRTKSACGCSWCCSSDRCASSTWDSTRCSCSQFTAAAAPNKRPLGTTNGLAQTVVAVQRLATPAAAASLFAFSLDNGIMGVTLRMSCCSLWCALAWASLHSCRVSLASRQSTNGVTNIPSTTIFMQIIVFVPYTIFTIY